MSKTLNTRYFSKPSDLRRIAPARLLQFLTLGTSFFESKGYALPENADELDHDVIGTILAEPEGMSEEFQSALFQVSELSKPDQELFDLMIRIVEGKEWAEEAHQDITNADLALMVFLNEPQLIEEVHAQDYITKPKSFQYFLAEDDADHTFHKPSEETLARLTAALNAGFVKKRRGENAKVTIRDGNGPTCFLVRHGEQFARQAAIQHGESTSVFFRPEMHDLLIYNAMSGELRMTTKAKWQQALYLETFGDLLFGNKDFFGNSPRFNFDPLRELGAKALSHAEFPEIEWIALREIQLYRPGGSRGQWEIRKADNLFESLEAVDETLPDGEIKKVTFRIKLKNSPRPRLLKIGSDNKEEVKNDQDRALFDNWLKARGFIAEENHEDE